MFYEWLDVLLPYINKIYNDSLASGTFPSRFKDSLVILLLKKKNSLDCYNLKNYRPVSNLSFISKVLERIVYSQFLNHTTANKLIEKFQSAYKPGYSTETALIKVVKDMLNAIDNGNLSLLTLLDLSAAFDIIDHSILLERLQTSFGIDGLPLKWVKFYLSNRYQKVEIDNNLSNVLPILYGVPQGSVLGLLLFSMYIYPLNDVIDGDKLFYHVYADDTQLYCSSPSDQIHSLLDKISTSTVDINLWMSANKLKMNNEMTKILLCSTNARLKPVRPNSLKISNNIIDYSPKVKNLGMCSEDILSMDHAVSHLRKCCYLELRKIANIRSYLSDAATLKLVLSLVISKLEYCNSLFYNMSLENIHKLQLIQNHAARLVKKASKRSIAKLLLKDLHWLPVKDRIIYKIAVLVFNIINNNSSTSYLRELITVYIP